MQLNAEIRADILSLLIKNRKVINNLTDKLGVKIVMFFNENSFDHMLNCFCCIIYNFLFGVEFMRE